jgi:polysaccharide biosynthesis protein PslH
MKVFWICHFLPYPSTGHGALQRTHHLIRELASKADVSVFAISAGGGDESDVLGMGAKQAYVYPSHRAMYKGAKLLLSTVSGRTYWEELFTHPRMRRDLRHAIAAVEPGVPTAIVLDTVFLAPVLNGIAHLPPIVLTHHNVESQLLKDRANASTGIKRLIFAANAMKARTLEHRESRRAAVNLMVSAEDGDRLRDVAGEVPTAVIPNGVDVDFFCEKRRATRKPFSLVFAGGMDWFPNRDAIEWLSTDLWPQLVADEPRRTLTIIGRSPPSAAIDLAARDSRVRVLGFVDDVRPYIEEADAYLCPIRLGGGTRLKVLDALAMRRPLVATALSVDGLELKDDVHYLRANSAAEIAAQLRRLDTDATLYAQLQSEGRQHVERSFSWTYIGAQLERAITGSAT